MDIEKTTEILKKGLENELFSCYAVAIGRGEELYFSECFGKAAVFPTVRDLNTQTLFDIASMTKLVGTAMAALRLIEEGRLSLDHHIGEFIDDCHGKERITVGQLMTHSSGIAAHMPLWKMGIDPKEAVDFILSKPLVRETGTDVIYSCMGYIVLGRILENVCSVPLDVLVKETVLTPLKMNDTVYRPQNLNCTATEFSKDENRYICGTVHDENARFLGGVSGNAGLFSPLSDIIKFSSMLSNRAKGFLLPETFKKAVKEHTPFAQESRGLGFHLYREGLFPGGSLMSKGSYGHTGFTGTSLYVDNKSGVYVALLTNRVHYGRDKNEFFVCRRSFHDAVFKNWSQK